MANILLVGFGGFIGAIFRYLISLIPVSKSNEFPILTLLINVIGALLMGIITALCSKFPFITQGAKIFITVGVLGGFTTFSTFSLESFNLIENGKYFIASVYIILSVLLSVIGIFLGKYIVDIIK